MSQVGKLNRRRKYGNVAERIQKIKDSFHIDTPTVTKKKPSPIFTYTPPKSQDEDENKSIN